MRDIVHRRCCGLDVHKDPIAACVRWAEDNGEIEQETRVFSSLCLNSPILDRSADKKTAR